MQDMFFLELDEKRTASMDDWFGESCGSRRVQDHEWMIECDRGEFEGLFWYGEKVTRRDTEHISKLQQAESTHAGWKRCPLNGS